MLFQIWYFPNWFSSFAYAYTTNTLVHAVYAFHLKYFDLDKEIIVSCGSGVTASVVFFNIHRLGKECCLYDGSWTEYSKRETV